MNDFLDVAGTEMLYSEFVRIRGTRERANDVTSPNISAVGDVELPIDSIFHYQSSVSQEVGPSNTYPFISNYPKRVNMFFNMTCETPLGNVKRLDISVGRTIKRYESAHFIYTRARNYASVMSKTQELLVNNLAIGSCGVIYKQRTIFTPFQESYNELLTLITSVNEFATYDRHQFMEIKLPKTMPTFKELEKVFIRYQDFFDENYDIIKYNKEALLPFQAEGSYWLLDLYSFLIGFEHKSYSLFSKLSEKAVDQLEIIFSYNGKCWIVNLGVINRLISADDAPDATKPGSTKINYFKRFYLSLMSLVSPIVEEDRSVKANGESNETSEEETQEEVPSSSTDVDPDPVHRDMADLYSSNPGPADVQPNTKGDETKADNNEPPINENDDIVIASNDIHSVDSWGKDLDDSLFEVASVTTTEVVEAVPYSPTSSIDRELNRLAKTGGATSKEIDYFKRASESYKDIEIDGQTIEEIISYKHEDTVISADPIAPDSFAISDKSALKSNTQRFRDDYIKNLMNRQIVESILHVQNGKVALLGLEKETTVTADSKYVVYNMKLQPIQGAQSTRRIRIPLVEPDGTFLINGVRSYSQNTRVEKPIRKLTPSKVALTSYYPRKIMIERSTSVADDYVRWLKRAIVLNREVGGYSVKLGGKTFTTKGICFYYSILVGRFKSIETKDYLFNFDMEETIKEKGWGKYCDEDTWVIGEKNGLPLLIDKAGLVTHSDQVIGYIETILKLDMKRAPVGYSTVNISGYKFPAVVVLSYWMGFNKLLEAIKADYRVASVEKPIKLEPDEFMINFSDERLIFSRRNRFQTLILAGLLKLDLLKNFSRSHLDDPTIWFSLINEPRVKPSHFKEMDNIFNMFIDPFCARRLQVMGYPTEMDKLTIEAIKLLLSNEAPHEVEITEQVLLGYEKFAGHIYSELCKATRQLWNKPNSAKKTLDLNPEAVMMNIITDSSTQACEEVNPFIALKQCEEVTFGGTFGRSENAMVRRTRGQLDNYAGVISEAGKDSGKTGFVTYLTSDAKIADMHGNIDLSMPDTTTGKGSVALNLFYGGTKESAQRTLFTSVQASQMMATNSYEINPIRMSYDVIVAHRDSGEMYSSIAKEKGVVTEVTPYGIKVKYENGNEDRFPIGYEVGKGAGEYHKHNKITDMKVGDTFKAGQILAWDELFFARDPFDKTQVAMKTGMMVRVALFEEQFTFEDSMGITSKFARRSNTPFLKSDSFVVRSEQSIKMHVKVGDVVEYDSILCDIQDPISSVFDDDSSFDGLERYGIKQQRAKLAGKITKIDVTYNGDIDDWDKDLKKFIKAQDAHRGKVAQYKYMTASTGNVGGNTSIGKNKVYPDTALVVITIEANIDTTTADKLTLGNQMKGTVGYIYPNAVRTIDGRDVDLIFSVKSILARMVLSMRDKLALNEVNNSYVIQMKAKYGEDLS